MTARPRAINYKHVVILSGLFAVLLGSLVAVEEYPKLKKIDKRSPAPESVTAILPGDLNAAASSVVTVFNDWGDFGQPNRMGNYQNKFPHSSSWSHFFLFHKHDVQHPLFPSDEQILSGRGADSFVKRYVRIPPELRAQDLYLYEPTGDYYWESEYFYDGQPAKFRCSFLIHLEPAGDSGSKIEIFEYQPTIWAGEYLGLSGHAILPGMLHDIRAVEATTANRTAILEIFQKFHDDSGQSAVPH
jgi:hypothetical protein